MLMGIQQSLRPLTNWKLYSRSPGGNSDKSVVRSDGALKPRQLRVCLQHYAPVSVSLRLLVLFASEKRFPKPDPRVTQGQVVIAVAS